MKRNKKVYISLFGLLAKIKCKGVILCFQQKTGQLADYCSHFKLLGFVMVERKHSWSWLTGEAPLSPGGVMDFSGGSLSSGSEWSLPSDHPVSGERGGVAPWMAEGDSDVFLLSSLWLPDQGLGTQQGESRACILGWLRVSALGRHHLGAQWPFPSGSGKRVPR